ncbi:MAG: hypothetical protein OCU24_00305 [Candidatus Methanospirare jalkutatii]|nr:hypothetical protein [Candidatus Methanospirare jalkutatii]
MSKFFILRTEDRKGAKDDYIICVNPSIKKSKHLGRFAVLVHKRKIDKRLKELKVPCRVVIDETLGDYEVRVDQSLRNALGIPYEFSDADKEKFTVEIYPLRLSLFQHLRYFLSYILGRRYLFFRVCKADIPDMEKNICRIPSDSFKLLGCEEGDRVICEYPVCDGDFYRLRECKIKCYEASEEMIKKREGMEEENISARYPSAEKLLDVSPDIPRIFLDAHARDELYVEPIDPVRVRRDLFHLFLKQIREFGIILLLSLLTVAYIFPFQSLILIFVISVAITFLLILMNIRAKIK